MRRYIPLIFLLAATPPLGAHPMGNFSVNHYSGFELTPAGVRLHYVVDLAEIPTLELLRAWGLGRGSDRRELEARASAQSRTWLANLKISANGRPARARFLSSRLFIGDGAGGLAVARISIEAMIDAREGDLAYEDLNYPDRAGWKEIVIRSDRGVNLTRASQTDRELSRRLTAYPPDPALAPPQDLRAEMEWRLDQTLTTGAPAPQRTTIAATPQPHRAPAAVSPALSRQAAPPGTVVRGDLVSRILGRRELTPWMALLAFGAAFCLGAAHALTPGHGKTIVAAYLVGSRGTMRHAALLGAVVTFTHTISVFALGLATLLLFRFIVPEKIAQGLGVISGLSIVLVGGWMIRKRIRAARHVRSHAHDHAHAHHAGHSHGPDHPHGHNHDHHHAHTHGDEHGHSHGPDHPRGHNHDHHHAHTHGDEHGHPHSHAHMPEELSWSALVALGVGGGLIPCESALVIMLSAIAVGRAGFGLLLLLSFSLGLATVLVLVGACVLYAKKLIPDHRRAGSGMVSQWLPVASAVVVILVGLVMTGVSAGVIQPRWMIG